MKKPITFEGLKVRPSYDDLINLLDKPVIDKYPDRKASQLRNSHWLSQLDGDSFRAMDELHHNMIKRTCKRKYIKKLCIITSCVITKFKSPSSSPICSPISK